MSRTSDTPSAARSADATGRAPHVEEKWADAFVVELRLLDVPGDTLGAALAEVESHCAESGESAAEAFGDPVAYAHSLDLPARPAGRWDMVTVLGPVATQILGILLLGAAGGRLVTAWRSGGPVASVGLTTGMLLGLGALALALALFARHSTAVLRLLTRAFVVPWLVLTSVTTAVGIGVALLDQVVLVVPTAPVAAVGVLLLVAGALWGLVRDRGGALDDPIVSPLPTDGAGAVGDASGGASRRPRVVWLLVTWGFPLVAVLALGATWLASGP
ncbi:hypothetical protein [Oerskovia turbata]